MVVDLCAPRTYLPYFTPIPKRKLAPNSACFELRDVITKATHTKVTYFIRGGGETNGKASKKFRKILSSSFPRRQYLLPDLRTAP